MATLPDYSTNVADPFTEALKGYQLGMNTEAVRQDQMLKQQASQQQFEQKQNFQTGLNTFFKDPNRKYEDLERILPFADKQQFDALIKVGEGMEKRRLDTEKRFSAQTLLALESDPTVAKTMLQERFEAETDPNQKRALETYIKIIDVDPKRAAQMVELTGAATFGKDWYEGITNARTERRTAAKAPSEVTQAIANADKAVAEAISAQATATNAPEKAAADAAKAKADAEKAKVTAKYAEKVELAGLDKIGWDVKNLRSQIGDRSSRLKLDQQTTAATVAEKLSSIQKNLNDIPADTRKLINEAAVSGAVAKQSADQFNDLAKRIEGLGGYGKLATLGEFAKSTIGAEGYETSLRQEYTRLRNQAAIKSLPPGPATDKDIEMALKGFPKDTSDSKSIAQFLKGMAKLQEIEASVSNAKTDWLAQNRGTLTRAGATFTAGDYAVKPGETFNDFSQRVAIDVNKKYASGGSSSQVDKIPTDRNPTPGAPQNNVRSQADAILAGGR